MTSSCFPYNISAFFSFLFRCDKPQITRFVLSFFLFDFNLYFSRDYDKKRQRSHLPFFLSFFLLFCSFFFTLNFSFFKDYNKKHQRSHLPFFLSSFLSFFLFFLSFLNIICIDTQMYTLLLYIIRRLSKRPLFFTLYHFVKLAQVIQIN